MSKTVDPIDRFVFQIDNSYHDYISNKTACGKENIHKDFCTDNLNNPTTKLINQYIINQLLKEHPQYFSFTEKENIFIFSIIKR